MKRVSGLRGLLILLVLSLSFAVSSVEAANIAVLSNQGEVAVAADFNVNLTGHTFTGVDVSAVTPTLVSLLPYDAILLFENGIFLNSVNVGNRLAEYANTGRPVILGTFYEQNRSDSPWGPTYNWGALETLDPNTTDGIGCPYAYRSINPASIIPHPLTTGVTSLFSGAYAAGNQAKAGSTVLALWSQPNNNGQPDPAIAYRITGPACVIHIGIFPDYPSYGTYGVSFGGDFYQVWQNAFDFAVNQCSAVQKPPTCALTAPVPTAPTNVGTFPPDGMLHYDPMLMRPFDLDVDTTVTGRLMFPCWKNGNVDIYLVVHQSPYGQLIMNNFHQWLPYPANLVPWKANTAEGLYVQLFSYLKSAVAAGAYQMDVIIVPSGTPGSAIPGIVGGTATTPYYKWRFTKTLP